MPSLKPSNFFTAEQKRNLWLVHAEPDHTPDQLLSPNYWAHVAKRLRMSDRIEVLAEDMSWWAEVMVLESGHNWAKVGIIAQGRWDKAPEAVSVEASAYDDFEIKHRGVRGFSVIRRKDGQLLKEGLKKREDAVGWLADYLKTIAG